MSLPVLIVGGSSKQRREQVNFKPHPDLMVLGSQNAISIRQVRELEKFLQRRPYERLEKTVVIDDAERLTLPAQHALLKTLEEPPANSQIILLCPNQNLLLPTLISRCLVKRLKPAEFDPEWLKQQEWIFKHFNQAAAEAGANSQTAKEFITNQLRYLHYKLRSSPNKADVKLIKALNLALSALKVNVNPKLTLDVLSLSY